MQHFRGADAINNVDVEMPPEVLADLGGQRLTGGRSEPERDRLKDPAGQLLFRQQWMLMIGTRT